MKFSAVQHRFQPLSNEALAELVRKHLGPGRVEQGVYLDEVGLAATARQVAAGSAPASVPVSPDRPRA